MINPVQTKDTSEGGLSGVEGDAWQQPSQFQGGGQEAEAAEPHQPVKKGNNWPQVEFWNSNYNLAKFSLLEIWK